ncbi:MAG: EF-hand domain-containing protein [Acetobacter sp.]|nr:EF-hand domain-containing protein [Acetobacter sp.]
MKKLVLFLTCSIFAVSTAQAMNTTEYMNAVKDIFSKEFQKIDTDGDGTISAEEYMLHQLESLQKSLNAETKKVETEAAAVVAEDTEETPEKNIEDEKTEPKENVDPINALAAALGGESKLNMDNSVETSPVEEENTEDDEWYLKPEKLTLDDVLPEDDNAEIEVPEIDLSISEDESLNNILADMAKEEAAAATEPSTPVEKTAAEQEAERNQLQQMLSAIRKTLPKKIDNITTWTDIQYHDNEIDYIYKADVDTNKFSTAEKSALKENIEKVACNQAYAEMCPTIKTMFIDKGINMKIRYYDKTDIEISYCIFNTETCK